MSGGVSGVEMGYDGCAFGYRVICTLYLFVLFMSNAIRKDIFVKISTFRDYVFS